MAVRPRAAVGSEGRRRRGRPRLDIDQDELLDAVERLVQAGGIESVTIERAAQELGISRATLYRAVRSKEQLLGRLFKRMTEQLTAEALLATADQERSARERLDLLIRAQIAAAIRTRDYMFVFFGRDWLEEDVYEHWRRFVREFEEIWDGAVIAARDEGALRVENSRIATRLILGMLVWIARWYRPGRDDEEELVAEAIRLLGGNP